MLTLLDRIIDATVLIPCKPRQDCKESDLATTIMEFVPSLPFVKIDLGRSGSRKVMDTYFEGESFYPGRKKEFHQRVSSWMGKLQETQWRSRTKRCLKESSEFSLKGKGSLLLSSERFPLEVLKKKVEEHLHLAVEKPSDLVKCSPEITVSILEHGDEKLSIKHYHPLNFWDRFREHFRHSKGMKAWVGGNGLGSG
jgi:hypothetical protein